MDPSGDPPLPTGTRHRLSAPYQAYRTKEALTKADIAYDKHPEAKQ